jgi:erythromycin esterase
MVRRGLAIAALLAAVACARHDPIAQWVRTRAIPIRTTDPAAPLDDLAPLQRVIGDATVVGLGEATHGTSEFFRLKHRLFELLVTRMGFRVFAIEANLPEAFTVNEYVLTGKGDPKQALAGLYFWTWDTYEVLDLIEWMRRWNATHAEKLAFYGIDMQTPMVAAKNVLDALPADDPAREALAPLARTRSVTAAQREAAKRALERLIPALHDDVLQRNAIVLQQCMETQTNRSLRDRAMADNLLWIRQREHGAKIAVWAHNYHISRGTRFTMGTHLARALGASYRPIGFAFGGGTYRAFDMGTHTVHPFTLPLDPPETFDGELARIGPPLFAIDLRDAPLPRRVTWRQIGAVGSNGVGEPYATNVRHDFDALVFVRTMTSAHATPTGERPARKP